MAWLTPMKSLDVLLSNLEVAFATAEKKRIELDALPATPRPGDVYLLPSRGECLVYAVVTGEESPGSRRWCITAADDHPIARPNLDVKTSGDEIPLTIRVDRACVLSEGRLPSDARVGSVGVARLAEVELQQHAFRSGTPQATTYDETLADTLDAVDVELRRVAEAHRERLVIDASAGRRENPWPPLLQGAARSSPTQVMCADDPDVSRRSFDAANNQPTWIVLNIDDDSVNVVAYPGDGVYVEHRRPIEAPPLPVRARYSDRTLEGEWEALEGDLSGIVRTRDPFPWEDNAVDLEIGEKGYQVRITKPAVAP